MDNPRVRRAGSSEGSSGSGSTKEKARQQSGEVAEQGRERAESQIATQKERAAGQLEGVAQALQQTGQQLREQDQGFIGRYADQAADGVERFSGFLRERDANQLIGEAEDLARRQPAVFLGGAFALGVAAARFLKSSSSSSGGGAASGGRSDSSYGGESYAASRRGTARGVGEGPEPSSSSSYEIEEDRELDREGDLRRRPRDREE